MDAVDNVGQVAEGRTMPFQDESAIDPAQLKVFAHPSNLQYIKTVTHEFSAVCPFSGLPDLATVVIEYFPASGIAVELKSLKYYMLSYRNVGIYQEGVTKRIYDDLRDALYPKRSDLPAPLRVTTFYHVRGGFYTTCIEGDLGGWEIPEKVSYPENF